MVDVYIISGPDASGKSTQINRLQNAIENEVQTVWLRHKHFLSLFPLFISRVIGCTIHEEVEGYSYQYHRFSENRILGYLYIFCLFIDLSIAYILWVYLPLKQNKKVICDRGPLDTLIDLKFKLGIDYRDTIMEYAFMSLPPKNSKMTVLYASSDELKNRRTNLRFERSFDERVKLYYEETERLGLKRINTNIEEECVFENLVEYLFEE